MGMSEEEKSVTAETPDQRQSSAPLWFQRLTMIAGWIALVVGMPVAINLFCIVPFVLLSGRGTEIKIYGVVSLTIALLTLGAGAAALLHASRSLQKKPSKPLQLPPPILLVGAFFLLIGMGLVFGASVTGAGLFFVPILVACAILPPLWAVGWMIPRAPALQVLSLAKEASVAEDAPVHVTQPVLTWRRGLLSFAGGATVSVFIAILLEIILPVIVLSLVNNLADQVLDSLRLLFRELANTEVANALTNPSFIYIFVQIALIAPLAEEIAKPLVTLPLLRRLDKKEAFWVGAMAGAGFAALENIIYATAGLSIWAGILVVRALGSALHPLGSGLIAQGWWGVLRAEKDAGKNWWKRFGIAVAVHAAWNGGSLLVITLGGARFFGELPPEIDLLGLSAAGTTLAFVIILGIVALWIGRLYGHDQPMISVEEKASPPAGSTASDRTLAVWAIVCLVAVVPIGIAGLKLWLH
jgi:RsiW-degrading membrane proteinase PrsW (M82 family)